jgi:hypothetical protein
MSARYLLIWILAQLISLSVSAAELPLSAHYPRPPEKMAARQMAIVQITMATLLFPAILPDWTATLFAIAAALPMTILAGSLGRDPWLHVFIAEAVVIAWMLVLFGWGQIRFSRQSRCFILAFAALFALSGPLLVYLQAEYGSASPIPWNIGPIQAVITEFFGTTPWPTFAVMTVLMAAALAAQRLRQRAPRRV